MGPPSVAGKKPMVFNLSGEMYYIGADVGNYLKCHRGKLYKHYPNMWRRTATQEEKKQIQELAEGISLSSNVMLVRAEEVEEIFAGNDEKYRIGGAGRGNATPGMSNGKKEGTPMMPYRSSRIMSATPSWFSTVTDGSHMDTVASAMPIGAGKGKPRSREAIFDLTNPEQLSALANNARQPEELVPIKLDLDLDGLRIRDAFCYNKNELLITPEMFAEMFCDDLEITHPNAVPTIAASIRQQLASFEEVLPMDGAVDQRAQIKLNINVQNENLTDAFEWDLAEKDNSPEEFSLQLCRDLNLGGEFVPSIAYAIRGQVSYYRRTFAHSDAQMPTVNGENPVRTETDADTYAPKIDTMTEADLEKKMRDSERNTRRMRRLNATPYGNY